MNRQPPNATLATYRDAAGVLHPEQSGQPARQIWVAPSDRLTLRRRDTAVSLEIEGGYDGGVIGLGIFSVDGEGGGLVVQDLVVDF
jgi:hypothetical protein